MPVAIPVGAKPDEASFKALASQADQFFKATGKEVGEAFAKELADGLASGERAVAAAARRTANSYDKVADATGKVRVEQEKLNAAQASGNNTRIVAQAERLDEARRRELRTVRQLTADVNDLNRVSQQAGSSLRNGLQSGFSAGFGRSMVGRFMADFRSEGQARGHTTGLIVGRTVGAGITAGVTAATGGIAAVLGGIGVMFTKGFQRYESIDAANQRLKNLNRTLAATGKAQIDIKAVMDTVNNVVEGTPFSLDQAFGISTQALASNTGDLHRFMTVVADAAGFTGDNLDNIGQAFLKVANQGKLSLTEVRNELRNMPIQPWLAETLGVTPDQISKMITDGQIGLDTLMKAVEQHASGFAKSAGDSIQGSLKNLGTAVARTGANLLGALFGAPTDSANTLKSAIDVLTGRMKDLERWVTDHKDDIRKLFEDGVSAAQSVTQAVGFVVSALGSIPGAATIAVGAFAAFGTIKTVGALSSSLSAISTLMGVTLPASAATGAAAIAASFAPVVAVLATVGAGLGVAKGLDWLDNRFGKPKPEFTAGPATLPEAPRLDSGAIFGEDTGPSMQEPVRSGSSPSIFGDTDDNVINAGGEPLPTKESIKPSAPAGAPILAPSGISDDDTVTGGSGGGGRGSAALPHIDEQLYRLPGSFTGDSNIDSARMRLEEARLRELELEAKGNASQSQLLAAKNNVMRAEQALRDAESKATDAHASTLQRQTSAMQKIGADIDQDFGISKGLPGLAENLTKFLANLAFAPAYGHLMATMAADTHPVGGASAQMFAGGGMVGGGMYGGNVGAMMALAQSSSGRTAYGPASDLVHGLADCSGSISDLVEMLKTGQTTPGRLFTTTDFATDELAARQGFLPGYMPGALNVGVTPLPGSSGHMAATLPNGVNFEGGGGTGGGAQYGGSATGALDPQFSRHYYMPVGPMSDGMPAGALGSSAITTGAVTPNVPFTPPTPVGGIGGGGMGVPGSMAAPPSALPGMGASPGQMTLPGPPAPSALPPSVGAGGQGFQGIGGLPMEAAMDAAMALGPAGIAAQKGMQLADRAIGYVGQLAGIGVSGLLQTFLPHESPLADAGNSWIGRIASGFAGARPASKNMAGTAAAPKPATTTGEPGQGGAQTTNNITVNNNGATEDGNGKDIQFHLMNQNTRPGPRR